MKGEPEIHKAFNKALAIELTAINQYFVQAKMCLNWGFAKLGKRLYDESLGEMKHADNLIERILFLEGIPNAVGPASLNVGKDVPEILRNDLHLESSGVRVYNEAIELCISKNDAGSREILEHILADSEAHVDWIESQLHIIATVGAERYLAEQLGGGG